MWLIVPFVAFLIFVIIGGAVVGGIYADVLIPIVVIILIAVGATVVMRRRPSEPGRPRQDPGSAGFPPPVGGAEMGGVNGGQAPSEPAAAEDTLGERGSERAPHRS